MPKTDQGKARSAHNATKHGLTSQKMYVLQNENAEAWKEMLRICAAEFQPVNEYEEKIVEEIAFAKWRLRRLWTVETALWDNEMDRQAESFAANYESADEGLRQAVAFQSLAENKALSLLSRYETRLKRDYRNAIKALEERRAKRTSESELPASQRPEASEPHHPKVVQIRHETSGNGQPAATATPTATDRPICSVQPPFDQTTKSTQPLIDPDYKA